MGRLVSDIFIRRLAQIILLAFGLFLFLVCVGFDCVVVAQQLGFVNTRDEIVYEFMQALQIPYQSEFAEFFVAVGSVFPILVAAVCFSMQPNSNPPVLSDSVNGIGHAFIVLLIVGLLSCVIGIIFVSVQVGAMQDAWGKQNIPAIKSFLTGVLSLQAIYLLQLLGLKPK